VIPFVFALAKKSIITMFCFAVNFVYVVILFSCCVVDVANHTAFDYLVNPHPFNPAHLTGVFNQIGLD